MEAPGRFVVAGLVLGAVVVGFVLVAAGLAVPVALMIGFLVVGVPTTLLGRRLGPVASVLGTILLVIAGLLGVAAAVGAFPGVNGVVVAVVTAVVEAGVGFGLYRGYRRLDAMATAAGRRRLAGRRGWRYEPAATVGVPGPRTAPRLVSVPNDAPSTTGRNVLYATVDGIAVTVFDRSRPRRHAAPVQTTWLVHLPMSLPFVLSSFLAYLTVEERAAGAPVAPAAHPGEPTATEVVLSMLDPDGTSASGFGAAVDQVLGLPPVRLGQPGDHTTDLAFARALMTPEVRGIASARDFPLRWWIEGAYLCFVRDDEVPRGAGPAIVEEYTDRLAAFAARLPWPALAPYATSPPDHPAMTP